MMGSYREYKQSDSFCEPHHDVHEVHLDDALFETMQNTVLSMISGVSRSDVMRNSASVSLLYKSK
jgi:hypothetical protein